MKFIRNMGVAICAAFISQASMAQEAQKMPEKPVAKVCNQKEEPVCLEVVTIPTINREVVKGCTIKIYCGTELITQIDSTDRKKLYFRLKRNSEYTIEVSKEGYLTRSVYFNTTLPEDVKLKPIFTFEYEVDLPRQIEGGDQTILDFPVALVTFEEKSEKFEHNKEYTAIVKQQVDEVLRTSTVVNK